MEITIQGLSKQYWPRRNALNNIELQISSGIFGVSGANESGKTTLLKILATRLLPSRGSIHINGVNITSVAGRHMIRSQLGYVPQELELYPQFTSREFLDYIALLKGIRWHDVRRREVATILEELHLTNVAEQKVTTLSGGMRRRLTIAQAFLADPLLIIIDDLTGGIDMEERMNIYLFLLKRARLDERTIIFSTQHMADIHQLCEQYMVLFQGTIHFLATRCA